MYHEKRTYHLMRKTEFLFKEICTIESVNRLDYFVKTRNLLQYESVCFDARFLSFCVLRGVFKSATNNPK